MVHVQRTEEKDCHPYFQLSTRTLFWKLKAWVAAVRLGLEINTFEMTSFPRCESVFYYIRKISHCPSTQTLAEMAALR